MPRPKQRQAISDFSGGLVTFPSPLDMRENQFQQLDEVDNMKLGRLEKVKGSANDAAVYTKDYLLTGPNGISLVHLLKILLTGLYYIGKMVTMIGR